VLQANGWVQPPRGQCENTFARENQLR